ncbi:MAG TPA: hypothetical protein VHX64_14890 [Caulobacteraceae bacterium]|nr:hypothetical protein [Caulobacteraceae bacterium]
MRSSVIWSAAVAALSLAAASGVANEPARADPIPIGIDCDRACLQDAVDQVLAAMVAHDAHRLPLSADIRYTENGQLLALTDGFWGTATGRGAYTHYFLDPRTEQAAVFATMKENGTNNDILAMRIKMEGRKISEIETVFSRTGLGTAGPNGAATLEAMGKPDPVWLNDNPDHASREDIIRTSNKYFTALENDDGKGDYSFFADDCWRFENGMQTTSGPHPAPPRAMPTPPPPPAGGAAPAPRPGPSPMSLSCKGGFQTGTLQVVTRIRDRRFPVVDEEKGVAFAFGFFDHNAQQHDFVLPDGSHMHGGLQAPFTWEIAEAFRIDQGKIKVVEAVINNVPYGMKAGWNGH